MGSYRKFTKQRGRVFPSSSYLSNCHETWPNFRLSSPLVYCIQSNCHEPWHGEKSSFFVPLLSAPNCRKYMLLQELQVNIHMVFLSPMKKWRVPKKTYQHFSLSYNQKINLSSKNLKSCQTLLSEIPFLQNQISFSPSSFFSLESESHLSQIFNSNLRHAFTHIPFHSKPAPPNYAIAPLIIAFFLSPSPPLHRCNT